MRRKIRRSIERNRGERRAYRDDQTRTVGDLPAEEFMSGIGEAVGSAVTEALGQAGAGSVDRSQLAQPTEAEQQRSEEEAQALREYAERRDRRYGEAARVCFQFERDPEIRDLPNAQARELRVMEYLDFHDWAQAASMRNWERANAIALRSYPKAMQRQLSTDPASGGALVPTILEGPIIEKRAVRDKLTALADQRRVSSGTLDVAVENVNVAGAGVAENAAASPGNPTYSQVSLRLKKAVALVVSSREEVADAAASMQLVRNISNQAGRWFGTYNNTQNTTGDGVGTNFTDGLLNNGSVPAVVGTLGAMTRNTFLNLLFGLPEQYTDNLVWLMSRTLVGFASQLEDSSGRAIYPNAHIEQTQPVQADSPRAGVGEIEGIPVVQVPDFGSIIMLANMDFFIALLGDGIRVETTTEGNGAFVSDQQQWKFVQRQDAAVGLPEAFRKTDGAVTAPA